MKNVLKGNFKTQNEVSPVENSDDQIEQNFEREALKRLGGSIAFVRKKRVNWDLSEKKD